ncbi:hypothetical protein KC930_04165 [Candidatus Saccharibacteria bacterium]|nr:hypothetical protein [Candidatus Saccharibacteria bacterium]
MAISDLRKGPNRALVVFITLFSVICLGLAGWYVLDRHSSSGISEDDFVSNCTNKPTIPLPVDVAIVESVLYPGQLRNGDYKTHGGFRLSTPTNDLSVILPLRSKLIDGARYIENGETQYLLDFETDCKIRFRFDHIYSPSVVLMDEINKLPEPIEGDSRTTALGGKEFDAAQVIATAVGFVKTGNVFLDFGMYDFNKDNAISGDISWSKDPMHQSDLAKHGVCWFEYLSSEDRSKIISLPPGDQLSGSTSDYCKN